MFLIFGKSGWIGGLVGELLKEQGAKYEYATARLEDRAAVIADIERVWICQPGLALHSFDPFHFSLAMFLLT